MPTLRNAILDRHTGLNAHPLVLIEPLANLLGGKLADFDPLPVIHRGYEHKIHFVEGFPCLSALV